MNQYKFWMIFTPAGNTPTKRHETKSSAVIEAQRLAGVNAGKTFVVLESICECTIAPQLINTIQHEHAPKHFKPITLSDVPHTGGTL
jgi:hypothetical protein